MSSFVFDVEANGLLDRANTIFSLVLKNTETKEVHSYNMVNMGEGINKIQEASTLIGHNILCYDIPLLEKIYGIKIRAKLLDTLLLSRMKWPEIGLTVDTRIKGFPGDMFGSYSLEAFGHRLKVQKIEHNDWSKWSPEMQKRCEIDVEITEKLWDKLKDTLPPDKAIEIETEFQKYIHEQEQHGVYFDIDKAKQLQKPLTNRLEELTKTLQEMIPPKKIFQKKGLKLTPFNPGSRVQIINFLCSKYNWNPTVFTDKGNPKLSEEVLSSLAYKEAPLFLEYFKTQKLLGMLSEGDNSWLNFYSNGKIHGRVITLGAITGRCTHSNPNLAQIPSARSFMGKEVRELFYAPAGKKIIGTDGKGLELRCFSHYLHPYDKGAYANEVVHGDVHTRNMTAAGLDDRDSAKTFIYALLYGAGNEKLGSIKTTGSQELLRASGNTMRNSFMDKVPAYKNLTNDIQSKLAISETLKGIDGRQLSIRHKHAALNTLLQNAGSVAMKLSTVRFRDNMISAGIEFNPCLHIHDEWEVYTSEKDAERTMEIARKSVTQAGEELGFKCPLDGDSRAGNNWYEVH